MNDWKNNESNYRSEEENRTHSDWVDRVEDKLTGNDHTHSDWNDSKAERKMDKAEKKIEKAVEAKGDAREEYAKGNYNDAERKQDKAEKKMDKAEKKMDQAKEAGHESDRDNWRTGEEKHHYFKENSSQNSNDTDYLKDEYRKAKEKIEGESSHRDYDSDNLNDRYTPGSTQH